MIVTANLSRLISRLNRLFITAGPIGEATVVASLPVWGTDIDNQGERDHRFESGAEVAGNKATVDAPEDGLYEAYWACAWQDNAGTMFFNGQFQLLKAGGTAETIREVMGGGGQTEGLNVAWKLRVYLTQGDSIVLRQSSTLGVGDRAAYSVGIQPIIDR